MKNRNRTYSQRGKLVLRKECTDPGRWDIPPDENASSDEILEYLSHIKECEYHAHLEQEMDDLIFGVVDKAYPDNNSDSAEFNLASHFDRSSVNTVEEASVVPFIHAPVVSFVDRPPIKRPARRTKIDL